MTDRYGTWTVHEPGECPVPPETMVQVQLRGDNQIDAEQGDSVQADSLLWDGRQGEGTVAYYRVLLEPKWVRGDAVYGEGTQTWAYSIRIPVLDGKPDFTRQLEWENGR